MSFNVTIVDPDTGEELNLPHIHHIRGGTYVEGGTRRAWLNVTLNYNGRLTTVWGHGLEGLDGESVQEAIPKLEQAVRELGTERETDYWANTPGNAGAAMSGLLAIAGQLPQGKLRVTW